MAIIITFLMIIGLLLVITEIFIPGFGFPGVTGVLAIIVSAALTVRYFPFGIVIVLGELVVISLILWGLIKWAKSKQLYGNLVLKDILSMEKSESGNNEKLIGKEGVAAVPLKPFGAAEFNGVKMDVYSDGAYIPKGRAVTVINVENDRIIVKEMN